MRLQKELNLLDIAINLCVEDREFYRKHKKAIKWKLPQCYSAVGEAYLKKKNYKKAIEYFLDSIKLNYKQKRVYWYSLLCLIKLSYNKLVNFFLVNKARYA